MCWWRLVHVSVADPSECLFMCSFQRNAFANDTIPCESYMDAIHSAHMITLSGKIAEPAHMITLSGKIAEQHT